MTLPQPLDTLGDGVMMTWTKGPVHSGRRLGERDDVISDGLSKKGR